MEVHVLQSVKRPSTVLATLPTLEISVKSSLILALLIRIPARMVALAITQVQKSTHVTVVMSSQEWTVRPLLITVHCSLPTVTMEAVWMVLELSPVNVLPASLVTSVTKISMSVKQLDA